MGIIYFCQNNIFSNVKAGGLNTVQEQMFFVSADSDFINSFRQAFPLLIWLLRSLAVRSFDKENTQTRGYKPSMFSKRFI